MRLVFLLLLLSLAGNARATDSARTLPISIEASPNTLSASGRWVADQKPEVPLLAKVNTAQIRCHKETMSCTEAVAVLLTSDDEPYLSGQALFSVLSEYKVESWTDSKIQAKSEKKVADVTLEIDLTSKSAVRRHQETTARGNTTADPNFVVVWHLR